MDAADVSDTVAAGSTAHDTSGPFRRLGWLEPVIQPSTGHEANRHCSSSSETPMERWGESQCNAECRSIALFVFEQQGDAFS